MPLVPDVAFGLVLAALLLTLGFLAARRRRERGSLRRSPNEAGARLLEARAREEWYALVLSSMDTPRVLESAAAEAGDARQVAHRGALRDDLLDVSRFTTGERALPKQRVPLQQVLDDAVDVARPLIEERSHRLRLELPSPVPTVELDAVRVTQAVGNLLTNAAKYTNPGGELTLGCRIDPDALVVFVRDTGIGIMPEMKDRIFEMFVQADAARAGSQGGLGIGLALVKGIAEAHGGAVEVASEGAARGSTFTIRLPRAIVVAGEPAGPGASPPPPARRRVLVADDNCDGAESLGILLRTSGHEVHLAYDGLQALALAERVRPDVALLDIGMPGLDGYEVAARIRRETWGAGIKLIAMTGWGQDSDKEAARAAGFDVHLTKPTDPERLAAALD